MSVQTELKNGHHVLPLSTYLSIGATLLVLTLITILVARVHLGPYNLVVAILIATVKASLVAAVFMHLWYDNKFYMMIFISALFFLAVFIVLTMFDTMRRSDIYRETANPIKANAEIYEKLAADSTAVPAEKAH